jgi:hypothetical protein
LCWSRAGGGAFWGGGENCGTDWVVLFPRIQTRARDSARGSTARARAVQPDRKPAVPPVEK